VERLAHRVSRLNWFLHPLMAWVAYARGVFLHVARLRFAEGWVVWCHECDARTAWHVEPDDAAAEAEGLGFVAYRDCSLCPACEARVVAERRARERESVPEARAA
jgi:hypothetical protein